MAELGVTALCLLEMEQIYLTILLMAGDNEYESFNLDNPTGFTL